MSIAEFYAQQQVLANAFLPEIQALRKQGVTGLYAVDQVCEAYTRKQSETAVTPQGRVLNRVELAFAGLEPVRKKRLLQFANLLAEEQGQQVRILPALPLALFDKNERAFIATALREMGETRDDFPLKLRFAEFHPEPTSGGKVGGVAEVLSRINQQGGAK